MENYYDPYPVTRRLDLDEISSSGSDSDSSSSSDASSDSDHPVEPVQKALPVKRPRYVLTEKNWQGGFKDPHDPLNADIDPSIITTAEIAIRIKAEIKELKIPQTAFANQLLGKTQGTLSDLLKKPKPWEKLQCGKIVWLRMYHWLNLDEEEKYEAVGMSVGQPKAKKQKRQAPKAPEAPERKPISPYLDELTHVQNAVLCEMFAQAEDCTSIHLYSSCAQILKIPVKTVKKYFRQARYQKRVELLGDDAEESDSEDEERRKPAVVERQRTSVDDLREWTPGAGSGSESAEERAKRNALQEAVHVEQHNNDELEPNHPTNDEEEPEKQYYQGVYESDSEDTEEDYQYYDAGVKEETMAYEE